MNSVWLAGTNVSRGTLYVHAKSSNINLWVGSVAFESRSRMHLKSFLWARDLNAFKFE